MLNMFRTTNYGRAFATFPSALSKKHILKLYVTAWDTLDAILAIAFLFKLHFCINLKPAGQGPYGVNVEQALIFSLGMYMNAD